MNLTIETGTKPSTTEPQIKNPPSEVVTPMPPAPNQPRPDLRPFIPGPGPGELPVVLLATPAWLSGVFSSGPSRTVEGRSRCTHRHAGSINPCDELRHLESRPELVAALMLEHMRKCGLVDRWKEQPYAFEIGDATYHPDFLFSAMGRCFVSEIKTKRFVTREDERLFEVRKKWFKARGITYVVWTDRIVLVKTVRHNQLRLKLAAHHPIEPTNIEALCEFVRKRPKTIIGDCIDAAFCLDVVEQAVWLGKLHIDLAKEWTYAAPISLRPDRNLFTLAVNAVPSVSPYWENLKIQSEVCA